MLRASVLCLSLLTAPSISGGQEAAVRPLVLAVVLEEADRSNPVVLAARKRWESSQARVRPAGTWPDPRVGIARETMPSPGPGVSGDASTHYSVEQDIPFPGKLTREAAMAGHQSSIEFYGYQGARREIAARTRILFYRILWLDETAEVLDESAGVLKSIARVAEARVATGKAGAEEALLARTQALVLENSVLERREQRRIAEIELNALLGLDGARWARPEAPELAGLPLTAAQAQRLARENAPSFLAARYGSFHAQAMKGRAGLGFAPDLRVFYEQERFRRAPTQPMLGLSLTVPLWAWKPAGELEAARRHVEEAEASSWSAELMTVAGVRREFIEVNLRRALALRWRDEILPLAASALEIGRKNYETGRTDFPKLNEAVKGLLEARMSYWDEVMQYGEHWAELEKWTGTEIKP